MFFLTRREQMVMILVMVALLAGAGIRHFRLERMLLPMGQGTNLTNH